MKEHRLIGALVAVILGLCIGAAAVAQTTPTVTIKATPSSGVGNVTPALTWSSSPVPDNSCTASGGWTGIVAGAGNAVVQGAIVRTTTYTVTCTWPAVNGSTIVNWTAPTLNTDGTPLTDIAGFRIVAGTAPDALARTIDVPDPAARSARISNLTAGTWYFGVIVYNAARNDSALSNIAQKVVTAGPAPTATASITVTVTPVPMPAVLTTVIVAGIPFVPVFRLNAAGTDIVHTPYGLIPSGRACGAKVTTWRGKPIHRVTATARELWGTTNVSNLAAPCA